QAGILPQVLEVLRSLLKEELEDSWSGAVTRFPPRSPPERALPLRRRASACDRACNHRRQWVRTLRARSKATRRGRAENSRPARGIRKIAAGWRAAAPRKSTSIRSC